MVLIKFLQHIVSNQLIMLTILSHLTASIDKLGISINVMRGLFSGLWNSKILKFSVLMTMGVGTSTRDYYIDYPF